MKNLKAQKWVLKSIRKDIFIVLLLAVLSSIISLCTVWFALISRGVVDIATGAARGDFWNESGKLIGILLLQAFLDIVNSRLNVQVLGKMEMRMNQRLFAKLFEKRWQSVSGYHSGDILTRMTSDVSVVVNALVTLIPRWVSMITRLVSCVVVLLVIDVTFTVVLLFVGTAVFFFSRFYGIRMKKIHKECQETHGKARSFIQECIENWLMVKSFDAQGQADDRLGALLTLNFKKKLRRNRLSNISGTAVFLLFSGSYYVALAWGAWRLASGLITFGTLTAFLQIVHQIQLPFRSMSGMTPQYYNMLASAERLMELEDLPAEQKPDTDMSVSELYSRMAGIKIKDLCFSYSEDNPVLRRADVYIKKGEFVAVKGHSGIGKSTLLRLLLGFLEPDSGEILLDIKDSEIKVGVNTRSLFAYVPQGNLILSGTIRQNISFGRPDASDEQIWHAAGIAGISDFIAGLPEGMETELGERGLGLSEGQIQRLSISRGVLRDAPIFLLDEATSALDEQTEAQILKNLRAMTDKTCICVSHRPAALAVCDCVLELTADGRITRKNIK